MADYAQREELSNIQNCLEKARNTTGSRLVAVGYCHNCYEDLEKGKLFCNSLCADQYYMKRRYFN